MFKHIGFIFLYLFLYEIVSPIYIFYAFMLYCSVGLYENYKAGKPIISLMTIIYISSILTAVANINLILIAGTTKNITYTYIILKHIKEASLLFCVSYNCIIIGMEYYSNKSLPSVAYNIPKDKTRSLFLIIAILFNRYVITLLHLNFLGSLTKIITLASLFGILFFVRLYIKENNKTYRTYAYTLYGIATISALLFAFLRSEIIIPTVILLIGFTIGYNNVKFLFSYKIIPFILIFIIFSQTFSDLGKYRGNENNIDIISNSLANQNDEDTHSSDLQDDDKKGKATLLERTANLAQITQVIKLTENNGFYNGRASFPLIVALVPRIFWPEKPNIELGTWFALEAGIAYKSDEAGARANNSINMTIPGELYLDFGWVGVVIGCILIGMFFSVLWNSTGFYDSEYNITGTLFGGYLFILGLSGLGADLQIVITLLSVYIVFYSIKRFL